MDVGVDERGDRVAPRRPGLGEGHGERPLHHQALATADPDVDGADTAVGRPPEDVVETVGRDGEDDARRRLGEAPGRDRQAGLRSDGEPGVAGEGHLRERHGQSPVAAVVDARDDPVGHEPDDEVVHRARGVQVAMLTGDNAGTAQRIARDLGVDIVLADVLPGQKADKVKELQAQGKKVGMVGDGVNDAPALTQADVGFAIGAGTDVAMESADVVLIKSDPFDVVDAIELSRATRRKMHQNLVWAVAYNVVAFPMAAGVFYPFVVSPEIAALAMSGSSALVAINALLLKRTRLEGIQRMASARR